MRIGFVKVLLACAVLALAIPAFAQTPRLDAIWAKRTNQPITLNGVLNEPAWAKAESVVIRFAQDAGIPGSGWKYEVGVIPSDPTYATLKFLVVGNQLYLGAEVHDQSVGGATDFNRNDGFLMSIKDHASLEEPVRPVHTYNPLVQIENNPQHQSMAPRLGSLPAARGRASRRVIRRLHHETT